MLPKVKICCISSINEAKMAIEHGAAALGLVGPMPSGPGIITNETIAAITATLPPAISSFLLTSETVASNIIQHHQLVHTNTIQIVDALSEGAYQQIKKALPGIKIVQVIHVMNEHSVTEALLIAEQVDALLLDSGNPNLDVKVLGGTGKTHNWNLSKMIVDQSRVPVFLAGGINAENVRAAIDMVQPFGVDLCSSVRTNKQLDPQKLSAFFKAVYS
jgi:phosphoribosylanthranilate isomerase